MRRSAAQLDAIVNAGVLLLGVIACCCGDQGRTPVSLSSVQPRAENLLETGYRARGYTQIREFRSAWAIAYLFDRYVMNRRSIDSD